MNEFGIPFKWWRSLHKSFDKFIDVRRMNWHVGVSRQFVSIVRHNLQNDEPHTECQTETNWISIEILSLFVRKWSRKRNRCVSSDVGIRQIAWNYLKFFDVSRCISYVSANVSILKINQKVFLRDAFRYFQMPSDSSDVLLCDLEHDSEDALCEAALENWGKL